jgi:hypothetical protein
MKIKMQGVEVSCIDITYKTAGIYEKNKAANSLPYFI